eukprot:TRINITY_DN108204_c0_g1_i1.p1 TRINITY_DN108204_c0_g1~~TRINITY_DN108204_c0_g1_i1.p1  ORF type:complete len:137 (-),score=4.15 TRINITY_DN108204_c0_g1_i1:122-532(-)
MICRATPPRQSRSITPSAPRKRERVDYSPQCTVPSVAVRSLTSELNCQENVCVIFPSPSTPIPPKARTPTANRTRRVQISPHIPEAKRQCGKISVMQLTEDFVQLTFGVEQTQEPDNMVLETQMCTGATLEVATQG